VVLVHAGAVSRVQEVEAAGVAGQAGGVVEVAAGAVGRLAAEHVAADQVGAEPARDERVAQAALAGGVEEVVSGGVADLAVHVAGATVEAVDVRAELDGLAHQVGARAVRQAGVKLARGGGLVEEVQAVCVAERALEVGGLALDAMGVGAVVDGAGGQVGA
jgi:hypothetical protein